MPARTLGHNQAMRINGIQNTSKYDKKVAVYDETTYSEVDAMVGMSFPTCLRLDALTVSVVAVIVTIVTPYVLIKQ